MNMDQARAGGEGMIAKKDAEKKDRPPIFESEDEDVKLVVPDGWKKEGEQFKDNYRE